MICNRRLLLFLLVLIIVNNHECAASLFSDECGRHALLAAYDPTTDTCWIVEKTLMNFDTALTRCNHMPGYEGHLGFPKTVAQMNFLYAKFLSGYGWYGWVGLRHIGPSDAANVANTSEWYWTYPNGSTESAATAPWYPTWPQNVYECGYAYGSGSTLAGTWCTNLLGIYCQYDRSTAHHETMLEHKCKALSNWFWWEESKSCLVFDTLWRIPAYTEPICTHIPGYRGHLAHAGTNNKLQSLITVVTKIQPGGNSAVGVGRDLNVTASYLLDIFWRREDGYKLAFDTTKYSPANIWFNEITATYGSIWSNYYLTDNGATLNAQTICEYQEDLRYEPTPLDIECAKLTLPHLYYKGSCYVREEKYVTYAVAKQSCNHIDGFGGHLATLHNTELLNLIYYTLTHPNGGYDYYWLGLERLNTTLTNPLAGYYWNVGNGQYFPLTDYSAFAAGHPTGFPCGNGYGSLLGTGDASLCSRALPYVCEYVEPKKGSHFRLQANFANMKTIPQAILKLYDDLYMQEQCGYQCTKEFSCRSIAFNVNTGICLIQSFDSSAAKSNIVSAPGYKWYDRY